jgi:DUF1365 family protein
MRSALYEGRVRHRRYGEVGHEFSYPLTLVYLDCDELPAALALAPLASATGPALVRLRREDLLGGRAEPVVPVDEAARDLVAERTGTRPDGPVRLLTALRSLGVGFNPVRFYYCWHAGALHSVVAEVTNTPWGERHAYVLDPAGGTLDKALHVSPFQPMDQRYSWKLTEPGGQLTVHLENRGPDGVRAFEATLRLHRRPLNRRALARVLWRHPPQTLRILAGIYGQAVRLKLKGARYHPHPRTAP